MKLVLFAGAALAAASPAAAQVSFSGEAGVVSDYRFRGLSLSNRHPAVQTGVTAEHESGFYAGLWGSSIAESEGSARVEIDLIAGYGVEIGGNALDANVTWYTYPGNGALNYAEANVSLSREIGALTPEVGLSYAPVQDALGGADNGYAFAAVDYALPGTPVTLRARGGFESGAFDLNDSGGKWDWEAGAHVETHGVTLGVSYIDSDARAAALGARDLAAPTVIASLTAGF